MIILSAAISGLLLTIVVMVIVLTCRKVAKKRSTDKTIAGWLPAATKGPHRYNSESSSSSSSSSAEDHSQSNVTSSLTVEDVDESLDSLPVNYSAFIKSENLPEFKDSVLQKNNSSGAGPHFQQQDIVATENTIFVRDNLRRSSNYVVFNQFTDEHDLCNNYSNPYVQSASPVTNSSSSADSSSRNISPFYSNIPCRGDARYVSSGRDNAVIKYLEGEVTAEELDAIKLGTHV